MVELPAPFTLLENSVREYAWGSQTVIPEICGQKPTGKPQAELWVGAHPDAPSRLAHTGERLDAVIAQDPARWLGREVADRFEGKLPFLLKILAAEEPLSIQCHPNRAQALAGFLRENQAGIPRDARHRNYRDENPKPELIVAVSSFRALKGFRPVDEIVEHFSLLDLPELREAVETLTKSNTPDGLSSFYANLMSRPERERARLAEETLVRAVGHTDVPAFAEVVRLAARYPGDLGALAPLYLNLIGLRPMEALFLGPGELHAYLHGTGIELMANSNNVVRGGLTPKHVDVPELLRLLTFHSGPPHVLQPRVLNTGLQRFETPAEEFCLDVASIQPERSVSLERSPSARIALVVTGEVTLQTPDAERPLKRGQGAFVAPMPEGFEIRGHGKVFVASVPPTSA